MFNFLKKFDLPWFTSWHYDILHLNACVFQIFVCCHYSNFRKKETKKLEIEKIRIEKSKTNNILNKCK